MIRTYLTNEFPCDNDPTVFDNFNTKVMIGDVFYSLDLWDTAGNLN